MKKFYSRIFFFVLLFLTTAKNVFAQVNSSTAITSFQTLGLSAPPSPVGVLAKLIRAFLILPFLIFSVVIYVRWIYMFFSKNSKKAITLAILGSLSLSTYIFSYLALSEIINTIDSSYSLTSLFLDNIRLLIFSVLSIFSLLAFILYLNKIIWDARRNKKTVA